MKKFNRGIVITMAAMIAAASLASCGNSAEDITRSEPVKAVQTVANTAAEETAPKTIEESTESKDETKKTETEKKEDKKKETDSKKKKAKTTADKKENKKSENKLEKQAKNTKQTKAPETKVPATVIPDDVHPVWVEGDMYAGTYAEETAGRATMEITRNSDGTYSVQVDWSSSASEKNI